MKSVIFIVGPTAVGKTDTAYFLAKKINARVISCDSMLVYKEPKLISGRPPEFLLKEVRHYFVGERSACREYNVFDYQRKAAALIRRLCWRRIPVIVCGGSGLYVKALLDGIFEGPGRDPALRRKLEQRNTDDLYAELAKVDPKTAAVIDRKNPRRLIRALEIYYGGGSPISLKKKSAKGLWGRLPIRIFGLRMRRDSLNARIDQRVDRMFEQGAAEEVKRLLRSKLSLTAQRMIGIKEIKAYLAGDLSLQEAKNEMKKNTRHFAKRQMTWFKADKRIEWLDVDGMSAEQAAGQMLTRLK
jgi:tRNA dimethylallyltransferase